MNKTMVFPAKQEAVGEVAGKISRFLKDLGADTGESMKTLLVLEETLGGLVEHAAPGSELKVVISRFMGKIDLEISVPGEDYDPACSRKDLIFEFHEGHSRAGCFLFHSILYQPVLQSCRSGKSRGESVYIVFMYFGHSHGSGTRYILFAYRRQGPEWSSDHIAAE